MCVSRNVASRKQSGVALIAFLLIFVTAASFALLKGLNETATQENRHAQTANALAEAKAALIGYAAGANIIPTGSCGSNCRRPGDLPCPDRDNNGYAGIGPPPPVGPPPSCGSAAGGNQLRRIGRLPWKTLGLPDLRDGSGERLWYAVSNNFKMNTRTLCGTSGSPGCLNSDSRGTISVRSPDDSFLHDGSNIDPYVKSGAVAVVIAAGPVLQRLGATSSQDRRCTVCNSNDICTASPPTNVPRCRPQNYLDTTADEDNAAFGDNTQDGFIQGDIVDTNGEVIVNDRLLAITYQDLMPLMEKRVVGEVLSCLKEYAGANNGRYPWAAKLDPDAAPNYDDDNGERFGRLPDNLLDETQGSSGGSMLDTWPTGNCKLTSTVSPNTWWLNWKEHVFYAVAEAYQPATGSPSPCGPSPNSCLTVNPPSPTSDRRAVVMVAGKKLAAVLPDIPVDQVRDNAIQKGVVTNYLEGENADDPPGTYDNSFTSGPATATFNDVTCNNGNCL